MPTRFLLMLLLALPGIACADAGNGNFMGYQLGDEYKGAGSTQRKTTTTGNLLVTAENPIRPPDIAAVTLLTTRESLTIGYISAAQWFATEDEAREFGRKYFGLLRAKYPDWPYGWEVMDAELNVVEVSFNQAPYNLRLRVTEDTHEGEKMWRFTMTLGWLTNSAEERAWRTKAIDEQVAVQKEAQQQLLKNSDSRGL